MAFLRRCWIGSEPCSSSYVPNPGELSWKLSVSTYAPSPAVSGPSSLWASDIRLSATVLSQACILRIKAVLQMMAGTQAISISLNLVLVLGKCQIRFGSNTGLVRTELGFSSTFRCRLELVFLWFLYQAHRCSASQSLGSKSSGADVVSFLSLL
ncbi:UNVERIFIED_CONTAM: hypothetical protein K2H54_043318 [Gekko kuhli]